MAAPFRTVSIKSYPQIKEKITRDTLYWKKLQFPVTKKEFAAITHIEFSPVAPYNYAVTCSAKVQIYNSRTNEVVKSITRFHDVAHSGSFRQDGRLLVAGGNEGVVRLFDVDGQSLLRVFKMHKGPVHVTKFSTDNLHILGCSDDKTVRLMDIPSEAQVVCYNEFKDYVRCGACSQASKDIVIAGSYDHTVKLFDTRTSASVMSMEHGCPVESVLMYPGGGVFLSAGGNYIKVWDALSGGRLLATFSNHHKTITSLNFCSNYGRLISASLDRHVKIYDVATYSVVHTVDFPSAILTVAAAPDDSQLVVGMADGLISSQRRKEDADEKHKAETKKASYKNSLASGKHLPKKGDHVVRKEKKLKMRTFDKYFRSFQSSKALDAAVTMGVRTRSPEVTVSVMQELIRREAIKAALAGRDDDSVCTIVRFIQTHISNPQFTSLLIDIANMILDIYADKISQSVKLGERLQLLRKVVDSEVSYMKTMLQLMGAINTICAAAQTTTAGHGTTRQTDGQSLQPTTAIVQ